MSRYPISFSAPGCSTQNAFVPCPCEGDPPAVQVITSRVRLNIVGATIGQAYHGQVTFLWLGDGGTTQATYDWYFTATATEESTGWADVPNPSGLDEPGWYMDPLNFPCLIEEVG